MFFEHSQETGTEECTPNPRVIASLHAKQLSPLIECVALRADDMEPRLSGLDEF